MEDLEKLRANEQRLKEERNKTIMQIGENMIDIMKLIDKYKKVDKEYRLAMQQTCDELYARYK